MAEKIGPLTTDEEFFSALNDGEPTIAIAKGLISEGKKKQAYDIFHRHIASNIAPYKFYAIAGRERKPKMTDALRKTAERAMHHDMISCGVHMQFGEKIIWDSNPTPNKYKEWRWQLSRHVEALMLARAYRAEGNEAYIKEALDMLTSWIEQAPHEPYDRFPYDDTLWRTIECGIRLSHWVEIIYSAIPSHHLTPEVTVTIFKSLYEHCMRITTSYTHGNWLMMEMNGVALANLLFPIFKKSEEWVNSVIEKLTNSICHQIYPDGAQYELAPGYQGVVLSNAASIEMTLSLWGKRLPEEYYDSFRSSMDYFLKMTMADGFIPPTNDSTSHSGSSSIKEYAKYYGCSEDAKWLATDGKDGTPPDFNSTLLAYAGFVTFRSGWGEGHVSAFFDGGKFGRDHNHEDKLNFLIYDSDGPLLYEMGAYAYDDSPYRKFALRSQGHNVILVDGRGQNRLSTKNWNEASYVHEKEPLLYFEDSEAVFASAKFDDNYGYEGYDAEATSRCAVHERSVIMLKGELPRDTMYLVLDKLSSLDGEEHRYDALWHMNVHGFSDGELCASSERISFISSGFESMIREVGVTDGEIPAGIISPSFIQNEFYPAPQYTLSASGKDANFATLFIHTSLEKSHVKSVSFDGECAVLTYKDGSTKSFCLEEYKKKAKKQNN